MKRKNKRPARHGPTIHHCTNPHFLIIKTNPTMTRVSKKTIVNVSLSEAQKASNEYADASIKKDKLAAEMNAKISALRQKYEPEITELDEVMEEHHQVLNVYAIEQRKNWDGKSFKLSNCVIGFRTNPPSVNKKKGITWDAVVGLLKGNKLLKRFIKVKEEVDKAAILKEQSDAKVSKQLELIGVSIEQDENFFVEPKVEELAAA